MPKDVLFLAEALLLIAIGSVQVAARRLDLRGIRHNGFFVLGAGVVTWAAICTLTSTNRAVSVPSLIWVMAGVTIAFGLSWSVRDKEISAVYWVVIPAVINAVIFLLQRFHIWSPFTFGDSVPEHHRYTALLGNPGDAGSYFVAPALAIVVLAISENTPRRPLWIISALLTSLAIATGPVTSFLAFLTGLIVLMFVAWRRLKLIATVAVLAAAVTFATAYQPLRKRVVSIVTTARAGNYDEAFSGRVTPFFSALLMAKDHPIAGVGPGSFKWEYYPYKLEVERRNPRLIRAFAHRFNFGETHNDQLQTLAESGVIGYALFVLSIILIARGSFGKNQSEASVESPRHRFARMTSLPLAASLFVLTLAHFPLRLAAATSAYLFLAVVCVVWSRSPVSDQTCPAIERPKRRYLATIAASAVIPLLILAGYRWCYEPYRCNQIKKRIELDTRNIIDRQSAFASAQRAHQNLSLLSSCLRSCPSDVELFMLSAANDRILGRAEDAAAMYERALQSDRRPELYYNLALVQLELGRRPNAVNNLVRAVLFDRGMLDAMREDVPDDIRTEVTNLLSLKYRYFLLALN